MEYVEGQPIVDYCDTRPLDTRARLELFRDVCAAVQGHRRAGALAHRAGDHGSGRGRSDYELRFALALALGGRADAYLQFAEAPRSGSRSADLAAAERDYTEALDIYAKLQAAGTFSSGDMEYVTNARAQLEKIRAARAR
jgi:hypothetical protein